MSKLKEAEQFINSGNVADVYKGVKIFNELCMSTTLSVNDRVSTLLLFIQLAPVDGIDMLTRWRDMLNFLRNNELKEMIEMLVLVSKCRDLAIHDRMTTIVILYNNSYYTQANSCFAEIANDTTVLTKYRAEACRYLVAADQEEYTEIAQENLIDIINTLEYPDKYRYEMIVGYVKPSGIATILNFAKLKIIVSDNFLYTLQSCFFYNDLNLIEYRILSGQHLLSLTNAVDREERWEINDILLQFASDEEVEYNVRADAADVVHRMGETKEQRQTARNIITSLGGVHKKNTLEDRASNVYTDRQNVHAQVINDKMNKFIELIVKECDNKLLPFEDVHNSISRIIQGHKLKPADNHLAFKALNRISLDTATFTDFKVTAAEIFVVVWMNVLKYEGDTRKMLETRFVQELIDMANTCSSGHSSRLVNVLSLVNPELNIDYETQIVGCVSGRMQAKIRDLTDIDLREAISLGMLEDAETKDRQTYLSFVNTALAEIQIELIKEFVTDSGLLNVDVFTEMFEKSKIKWL